MKNENPTVMASYYFLVQGLAGVGWILLLTFHIETREFFTPTGFPEEYLLSVRTPDLLLFVGGSFAASYCIRTHNSKAIILSALTLGAVGYATFLTIATSISTGSAALASVLMGLSLAGTSIATFQVVKR